MIRQNGGSVPCADEDLWALLFASCQLFTKRSTQCREYLIQHLVTEYPSEVLAAVAKAPTDKRGNLYAIPGGKNGAIQ